MADAQDDSHQPQEDRIGDHETMHQMHQTNIMKAFLSKTNVGVVSRYILENPWIEIVSIDRIGEHWLMTLSNLDKGARVDIVRLIGFDHDHDHDHEQGDV